MRSLLLSTGLAMALGACAGSGEEQRRAQVHQQNATVAAANGQYGIAGDEQRMSEDAHHKAVKKAIDEGKPVPMQQPRAGLPDPSAPTP